MAEMDPHYQPKSPDPEKACNNCKNFEPNEGAEGVGNCFGHEVSAEGTCDFFETKE